MAPRVNCQTSRQLSACSAPSQPTEQSNAGASSAPRHTQRIVAGRGARPPLDDGGETFDLDIPDESSSSSNDYNPPPVVPTALITANTSLPVVQAVLAPGSQNSSRTSTAAHDVNHFFRRGDKKNTRIPDSVYKMRVSTSNALEV